jgi:hypothetical protein
MVQVSPFYGLPTVCPSAPQPSAVVNCTGVKLGTAEVGRPPSGASMIHSTLLPSNVAPGGHSRLNDFFEPSIKYELIVTNDDNLIAEISISRNFQNDVRAISIAGAR